MISSKGNDDVQQINRREYSTRRRKEKVSATVRDGPIPIENSVRLKKERPGQLYISESSGEESLAIAGSIELLEYFLRLSYEDSSEEYVNTKYISALLRSGADINSTDKCGQTVLHAATRDWHPDVARFLIDNGADVNKADAYGRTPIFTAVLMNYPEMVEFLAKNGANIDKCTIGERQTPVHYAVRANAVDSLKVLLKMGASVTAKDFKGRDALFVAVEQGNSDVTQFLLDVGCSASVYDNDGYSAMTHMVEKMPNIALEALSQFLAVDSLGKRKSYYLAPLEGDPKNPTDQKTVLQIIVKYKEMDLLQHPVIQRLIKMKWQMYARFHIINYFALNLLYCLLWTTIAIARSAMKDPFHFEKGNTWVIVLAIIAFVMTIASAVEQLILAKESQKSDKKWKDGRVASLKRDLRFCHPQWPNEREFIELQINRYSSMFSDYYKNLWTYIEWLIFIAATSWSITSLVDFIAGTVKGLHEAEKITLTVVIILVWTRFLKACRAFQIGGQFIAILGQTILALAKFAFLFFLFFIPFTVSFWVLFGGDANGDYIAKKYPTLKNAFRYFNDVVYTVWTMTLIVGFPMVGLRHISKNIANTFVALYYLVMSVVTLNLFIAFLSNVFSRVYKDAKKYALLEHASTILAAENFVKKAAKQKEEDRVRRACNPLTEGIGFREIINEKYEAPENTLHKVLNKMQMVTKLYKSRGSEDNLLNKEATLQQIKHNIGMMDKTLSALEQSVAKIQKLGVEVKKIHRILVPEAGQKSKTKSMQRGR